MQLKVVGRYRNGETAYEPGTIIHVKAEEAEFLFRDSPSSFEIHDDSVERAAAEAAAREAEENAAAATELVGENKRLQARAEEIEAQMKKAREEAETDKKRLTDENVELAGKLADAEAEIDRLKNQTPAAADNEAVPDAQDRQQKGGRVR